MGGQGAFPGLRGHPRRLEGPLRAAACCVKGSPFAATLCKRALGLAYLTEPDLPTLGTSAAGKTPQAARMRKALVPAVVQETKHD